LICAIKHLLTYLLTYTEPCQSNNLFMQPITDHNYGVVMCPLKKYVGGLQLFYEGKD